jgi:hypothetical protein
VAKDEASREKTVNHPPAEKDKGPAKASRGCPAKADKVTSDKPNRYWGQE